MWNATQSPADPSESLVASTLRSLITLGVRLTLGEDELRACVGAAATRQLFDLFGRTPSVIKLRRVEATSDSDGSAGDCVAFHTDHSLQTMQVPLNDDYEGGQLCWVVDGRLEVPHRPAGSATIHMGHVVHGVTAMTRGCRYGLFLCELPVDPSPLRPRPRVVDLQYLVTGADEQLRFFEQALEFLSRASDDELRSYVDEYRSFLIRSAKGAGNPSFEVEVVWRAHLLSPVAYAKDCDEILEAAGLEPQLIDHCPQPVEVYICRPPTTAAVSDVNEVETTWRDGLVAAVRRQWRFMQQMDNLRRTFASSSPLHTSSGVSDALAAELQPYRLFLQDAASAEKNLPVPSLTLDLVWHTHMLHAQKYSAECAHLCGRLIDHDDSAEHQGK